MFHIPVVYKYYVALDTGTVGVLNTEESDESKLIGLNVTVSLQDSNGGLLTAEGVVEEVLSSRSPHKTIMDQIWENTDE